MNRKDWIWIGVKMFGLYLGIQALLTIPPMLSNFLVLRDATYGFGRIGTPTIWMPFFQLFITFIIMCVSSAYLLRSGRMVYWLIGPSIPPSTPGGDAGGS